MVDEKEFEKLFNKYRVELYRYCLTVSDGDVSLADDAFSDLMTIVYDKWDMLEKGASFKAYLFTTAKRCLFARKRKRKIQSKHYLSLDSALAEGVLTEEKYYDTYFTDNTPIEDYIMRIESELGDEDLILFRLRYIEKRTFLEIAELMDVPYSSLRYKYFKLEKLVREKIKNIFENF